MKLSKVWSNGKIIIDGEPIKGDNFSLHYGPCVWEGIRAYKQSNGKCEIFKLEEHIKRLFFSAKCLRMKMPFTLPKIIQACKDVVKHNGDDDMYLRPVVYYTGNCEDVYYGNRAINVDIFAFTIPKLYGNSAGAKLRMATEPRSYPAFKMQVKCSANYTIGQPEHELVSLEKYSGILFYDNNRHITEASVANIFIIKGDELWTPPDDGSILPGITRRTVGGILQDPDIMFKKYKKAPRIIEKKFTAEHIHGSDEAFLCGTYAEVVPLLELDGIPIGEGKVGFYTSVAKDEYERLVRGK